MSDNRDWLSSIGTTLKGAKLPPSDGGWEVLEHKLDTAKVVPLGDTPRKRGLWLGVASSVAAVVVFAAMISLWSVQPEAVEEQLLIASLPAEHPTTLTPQITTTPSSEPTTMATAVPQAKLVGVSKANSAKVTARMGVEQSVASIAVSTAATNVASDPLPTKKSTQSAAHHSTESNTSKKSDDYADSATRHYAQVTTQDSYKALNSDFAEQKRANNRTSLSLFSGVTAANSGAVSGGGALATLSDASIDQLFSITRSAYDNYSFHHRQPLTFGLSIERRLGRNLSLESGLYYTLLLSDVDITYINITERQRLHYLGIPLRLNWYFINRTRFSAYVGAGAMVERAISASLGSESLVISGVELSAMAAVGAQYRISPLVSLYAEPTLSHYFGEMQFESIRSESPTLFSFRLGLRFTF